MDFLSNFFISNDIKTIENDINQGYNVKVNSVAGSGKTTTSIILSSIFKDKKILLLTYNKHLMEETKARVKKYNIKNLDVYTIHAFVGYITSKLVKNDEKLVVFVDEELSENNKAKLNYDLIILDECQDLTTLYFNVINKFLKEIKNSSYQLITIGDEKQCVYSFMGADSRFLTLADKIFVNKNNWVERELKNSYRVKKDVCEFINKIYKQHVIESFQKNNENNDFHIPTIKYCYWNSRQSYSCSKVCKLIVEKILKDGEEEVLIIAPSVVKNYFFSEITENIKSILSEKYNKDIYFYVTKNDLDKINDKDLIKNKLVISTIHQTKGLERKNVFLFNFDSSYYKFGQKAKSTDPDNEIYVALTRASSELYLMHEVRNDYFDFVDEDWLNSSEYIEKINLTDYYEKKIIDDCKSDENLKKPEFVTELIKFLPSSIIEKTKSLFDVNVKENFLNLDKKEIDVFNEIPSKIQLISSSKIIYEEVQTIIGSSLTTIYFMMKKRKKFKKVFEKALEWNKNNIFYHQSNFDNLIHKITKKIASINDLTYTAFTFNWILSRDEVSLTQIKYEDCSFLSDSIINSVIKILEKIIDKTENLEYLLESQFDDFLLVGKIDHINKRNRIVYEFKFVNDLSTEHILQLIFYKYLLCQENQKYADFKYILYNIKDNVAKELNVTQENAKKIVKIILEYKKYRKIDKISDDDFIKKHLDINLAINNEKVLIDNLKTDKKQSKTNKITNNSKNSANLLNKYEYTIKQFLDLEYKLPTNFVIIDFETWNTRKNPVQVSFQVIKNFKYFKSFNFYLKPNYNEINPFSFENANVPLKELESAKTLDHYWSEISEFFNENYIFIAHNAAFDAATLVNELKLRGIAVPNMLIFDTLSYLKSKLPTLGEWNLRNLGNHFNIKGVHHNAESDVRMLSEILSRVTNWNEFAEDYIKHAKKIRFLKKYY